MFKHALTQEVVYKGLLKKERKLIHERIGLIMEKLFKDRLSEFYETLAIHFSHGLSVTKAVYYLMKSGEKNLKRYAVEESHQYYKRAFELLSAKSNKSDKENIILIDLLIQWAWVFHYRADYKGLTELLNSHKELAEAIDENAKLGMFYAWLGLALFYISKLKDSYQYLGKALNIGEETEDQKVTNYACVMLTNTCTDLGLLDEAIAHGIRAQEISMHPDIYVGSLAALGRAYALSGEWKKALETGKTLLSYGQQHSNSRGMATGHWLIGYSHFIRGEFATAIECGKEGLQVSIDPNNKQMIRVALGVWSAMDNRLLDAEENLKKVKAFTQKFDAIQIETTADFFLGAVMIGQGHMSQGLKMMEDANRNLLENHSRTLYAASEYVLGKIYLQIVERSQAVKPITILKNIGFIIKNVPFATQKAETHFNKAIELATKIGAQAWVGTAYFGLGLLHKANKKTEKARGCILEAIKIFEKLELERYLRQAEEALASLE
jgi:tetratricopeptide (TPR) repeat protein